ncbi:MAG TPA: hypothetical protein VMB49_21760 [Acidobacteriaceae bacterium]|nr:hypothetical protein [Acidobacteriaceae bacterium]
MKHYALIFQLTRAFTPDEQQRRPAEIGAWVKKVTDMGIMLDPRNFGDTLGGFAMKDSQLISTDGSGGPNPATIVFFDSPSAEQAVEIARIHPGLRYGATVDVREWTSPRQSANTPREFEASPAR